MRRILLFAVFSFPDILCSPMHLEREDDLRKSEDFPDTENTSPDTQMFSKTYDLRTTTGRKYKNNFPDKNTMSNSSTRIFKTSIPDWVFSSTMNGSFNKPVFDRRWDNFIENHHICTDIYNLLGNSTAYFSVRTMNNASTILKENKWHLLQFKNKTFYSCHPLDINNCTEHIEDCNSTFFNQMGQSIWKTHNYYYFYTKEIRKSDTVYQNLSYITHGCIEMYLASCVGCGMSVTIHETNKTENFTGNGNWQIAKFDLQNITSVKLTCSITNVNISNKDMFWVIGEDAYITTDKDCKNISQYIAYNIIASKNKTEYNLRKITLKTNTAQNHEATLNNYYVPSNSTVIYSFISIPAIIFMISMTLTPCICKLKLKITKKLTTEPNEETEFLQPVAAVETHTHEIPSIRTEDFLDYVRRSFGPNKSSNQIYEEFKSLQSGYLKPAKVGKLDENVEENRFPNIMPYDENRVKLTKSCANCFVHNQTDYINASFVEGFNNPKEYILATSPSEQTENDFLRMIWQEGVEWVVMISSRNEKYYCYWPTSNEIKMSGKMEMSMKKNTPYEFYTHREFTIKRCDGRVKKINHLHFHAWSQEIHSSHIFLDFMNHLLTLAHDCCKPIVFHCLTGIDGAATLLLCDIALRTLAITKRINLLDITRQLRLARANSVTNVKQYQLAHLIIFQSLTYKCTAFDVTSDFKTEISRALEENSIRGVWSEYLENLDITSYQICRKYPKRNRYSDDNMLPVEHSRVVLQDENPDYIHAMFVSNYQQQRLFIVAQQPLETTLSNFWVMIIQNHVKIVINLNEMDLANKGDVQFFPTLKNDVLKTKKNITVQCKDVQQHLTYDKVDLELYSRGQFETNITILNVKNWPKFKLTPESNDVIIDIWEAIQNAKPEGIQSSPIVICCDDGITDSSLVVCFFYMVGKMLQENKCDVVGAVKAVRRTHFNFINFEQFVFLYQCALRFVYEKLKTSI